MEKGVERKKARGWEGRSGALSSGRIRLLYSQTHSRGGDRHWTGPTNFLAWMARGSRGPSPEELQAVNGYWGEERCYVPQWCWH